MVTVCFDSAGIDRKNIRDTPTFFIFRLQIKILRHKEIILSNLWLQFFPLGRPQIIFRKPTVLALPQTPKVSVINLRLATRVFLPDKERNGDALLNIEDILIFPAFGRLFFHQRIAVQIKDVDFRKIIHQRFPHASVNQPRKIRVVGNHPDDTVARAFIAVVSEADEFDVIVGERLNVALAADCGFLQMQQILDVFSFVTGTGGIRRIAPAHHN